MNNVLRKSLACSLVRGNRLNFSSICQRSSVQTFQSNQNIRKWNKTMSSSIEFQSFGSRTFSDYAGKTAGEIKIKKVLLEAFPKSESIEVNDISGGCGDMYEVHLVSNDFVGKRMIQQHKMVNDALKEEVAKMHGIRIFTSIPS